MTDLAFAGASGLSSAFAEGRATPLEAFEAYADRIGRLNAGLNAILHLRLTEARLEAAEATKRWREGRARSPIDGLTFAVKSNIALAGQPFHAGIGAYRDRIAATDAPAVAFLRRAGAVPIGVANMHEGALGATNDNPHFGRCRNPWGGNLTPGGSSGGSAAAVAARLCAFALGTDTMGSVRIPSAYCGVAGVKPTRGVISDAGLIDLSPTLDHVGVHATDASGLALVMRSFGLSGALQPPRRIGIARWGDVVSVERDVHDAFRAAAELLGAFAECVEIDISGFDFGALRRAGLLISEVEGHRAHQEALRASRSGFSDEFAGMLEWGARQSRDKVEQARREVLDAARRFSGLFVQAEVIVMPTAPQTPFEFGSRVPANQADFTCIANFGGFPAAAVPAATSGTPPTSIQFIAPAGKDGAALAAALAFETARGPAPAPLVPE
jgi:aspartyl-tRNA(Asn)/glutamyl-tRNA(Gln) amidotransferase subunit A